MEVIYGSFIISDDRKKLQLQRIREMLSASYWAKNRTLDVIEKTIDNSVCFGVYCNEEQIGFARCITDYSTMYWLCDVIINDNYRGLGLGKALLETITEHNIFKSLRGILATDDAHGLYMQYGFSYADEEKFMTRNS